MTGVLTQITSRQWRIHYTRLILTIVGITLGVAVFFAIETTNVTLESSLSGTIEKLAGRATLQLTGGDAGFSEDYLKKVRATPGVALSEPVTETMATSAQAGKEKILVLGFDTSSDLKLYSDMFDEKGLEVKNPLAFTSKADSIAVSRKFADRYGLKDGDKLPLRTQAGTQDFTIRAIFRSSGAGDVFDGNVAVVDVYASQELFGKKGRFDRIDVMNKPDVAVDDLKQRIEAEMPAGITVERPERRGAGLENTFSSMHLGLTVMSFLAFTVCAFLIFNSFAISVNQRWKEIGVLRAIGVTRGGIQLMFLTEAAIVGVIGSIIGVGVGFLLAKASIGIVLNVSVTLYGAAASPDALVFNYAFAAEAIIAGVIVSILAAWLPARAAARLDPVAALHDIENRTSKDVAGYPRLAAGVLMLAAGLLLTAFSTPTVGLNIQLFYTLLIQAGMILLLPKFIEWGSLALRPFMNYFFGVEGLIAVETLIKAPRRTASTVGALMIGLAFVYSTGAFVVSQKAAVDRELDRSLDVDILVTSSKQLQATSNHFSPATAERIMSLPGVELADTLRISSVNFGGDKVSLLSHDMKAYFAISPKLLEVGDPQTAEAKMANGKGVLISNNLAYRDNLKMGDVLKIDSPNGTLELPVVGLLSYYRSEKGTIIMDRSLFQKYWNDTDADDILINLKPGIDPVKFKQSVAAAIGGEQDAFIYTHDEFKKWVDGVIDQFFALFYLQMVIAIFVAALGLVNTMVISVDERRRELGIFRAIGGLRRQVMKMVLLEAVAISLIGLAAGAVTGLFNAYFLVHTAARVVAGFTVELIFPYTMVLTAVPFVIVVAVAAAFVPAMKAARTNVVEAVGYE